MLVECLKHSKKEEDDEKDEFRFYTHFSQSRKIIKFSSSLKMLTDLIQNDDIPSHFVSEFRALRISNEDVKEIKSFTIIIA
jgi:hypothetical protein